MTSVKLKNPNEALQLMHNMNCLESEGINVCFEENENVLLNKYEFNQELNGHSLKIIFHNGWSDWTKPYLTISLSEYDGCIEVELIQLELGLGLKINDEVVYYKIFYKTWDEIITFKKLKALDLSLWYDLESIDFTRHMKLESLRLTLGGENDEGEMINDVFDYESLQLQPQLLCLNFSSTYSEKTNTLSVFSNLEHLLIEFYDGWRSTILSYDHNIDLSFFENMFHLKNLVAFGMKKVTDVSFLNHLPMLEVLSLHTPFELHEITLKKKLENLKKLYMLKPDALRNLDFLTFFPNIISLEIDGSGKKQFEHISIPPNNKLKHLRLDSIGEIKSLETINDCLELETLSIEGCNMRVLDIDFTRLNNLLNLNLSFSEISTLGNKGIPKALKSLQINGCEKLAMVFGIEELIAIEEIKADSTINIRNIEKFEICKTIRELELDDKVLSNQIIMASSFLRKDVNFISEKVGDWIESIPLSKHVQKYISRLLNCFEVLQFPNSLNIIQTSKYMRSRGLQSEFKNDLDAYTWETWCNLALELEKTDALSSLSTAVSDLDIIREAEVILGPVIVATSKMIEKYPEEKENLINWVNEQLHLLEGHTEEQRQIAPSAAVFFASLNRKDDVLYWLQKATDEKAPLWRERVLKALVKHYAEHENFSEARRLLDEMQIQDEKDLAIASLAKAMATKHPVDAGFLLNDIHDAGISVAAARTLLSQPSMLREPQSIYQLLLHLQSNPDELAETLEKLIELDLEGKITDAVKQLFLQPQVTGPSASVLLELCKHPAVADFVKPRALEKYKNQLQERASQEVTLSIPQLIAEMQEAELLEDDEALELKQIMQTK